ncbi:hypothetical protein YC2023_031702 [Brassica napus]
MEQFLIFLCRSSAAPRCGQKHAGIYRGFQSMAYLSEAEVKQLMEAVSSAISLHACILPYSRLKND